MKEKQKERESVTQAGEDYLRHLERRNRALETELQLLGGEQNRLERELYSLKNELSRLKQPPLLCAKVHRLLGDERIVVDDGVLRHIVRFSSEIPKDKLKPGVYVGLNQRTYATVEIIPDGGKIGVSEGCIQGRVPPTVIAKPDLSSDSTPGTLKKSDLLRSVLQGFLKMHHKQHSVLTTKEGEVIYCTSDWQPDQADIKRIIAAWLFGIATSVTLCGIEYSVLQSSPDRFIATNIKKQGHLLGTATQDGSYILEFIPPDDPRGDSLINTHQ